MSVQTPGVLYVYVFTLRLTSALNHHQTTINNKIIKHNVNNYYIIQCCINLISLKGMINY